MQYVKWPKDYTHLEVRWVYKPLLVWLIVYVVLVFPFSRSYSASIATQGTFIAVSDIHFDPFNGCENKPRPCPIIQTLSSAEVADWPKILAARAMSPPQNHMDSNYQLWQLTLKELKNKVTEQHAEFVVILGDFLGHNFQEQFQHYAKDHSFNHYQHFTHQTLQFITYSLQQALPNIPIYPLIGNNDSYTGDYSVIPAGAFLKDAAQSWVSLIKDPSAEQQFYQNFNYGGYYAIARPENHLRLIFLDSVLFIPDLPKSAMTAAYKQLDWLKQELQTAKQQHQAVMIFCHIPVAIDLFNSFNNYMAFSKGFWQPALANEFTEVVRENSSVIIGILASHVHLNTLQITIPKLNRDNIALITIPSISPIFGNNPSFKILYYDSAHFLLMPKLMEVYQMQREPPGWTEEYLSVV